MTRPLPDGAEIIDRKGEKLARWRVRGKVKTAPVTTGRDGSVRIVEKSPFYIAKYRDGNNHVQEESTGCRDKTAALGVLADLERRAERIRAGVITAAESTNAEHQIVKLEDHFIAFEEHLKAKGVTDLYRTSTLQRLRRLAQECSLETLADLKAEALERWLVIQADAGAAAKTRNAYREALVTFSIWCVDTDRLPSNPFKKVAKADVKADPRRQRRSMTEPELVKLLAVARERPLIEALTVRKGARRGERYANVRPEVRGRLEFLGRERALIYKTLVLSGLRKAELASLTVAHLRLEETIPFIDLNAADEKNREGNDIPLRDDLAADLRAWLADKLVRLQDEARAKGKPIPARLPPDTQVFTVPAGLVRILNRDLKLAGIPKRDDRGRTLDVHALRHHLRDLDE